MGVRAVRSLAVLVLAASTTAGSTPGLAAGSAPSCAAVAASPDFVHDRTVVCTLLAEDDVGRFVPELHVTTDGGRSWQRKPLLGLSPSALSNRFLAQFSPGYAADRTILLATRGGLYATTNRGDTVRLVDSLATTHNLPQVAYVDESQPVAGGPVSGQLYSLMARGERSARTHVPSGLHQLVGSGSLVTERFLVPGVLRPGDQPLAIGREDDPTDFQAPHESLAVWGCTAAFVCADRKFTFPPDLAYIGSPYWFWYAPSPSGGPASVYALFQQPGHRLQHTLHAWRSTDGGATFTPWASVAARIGPGNGRGAGRLAASIAVNPARPRQLYLRIDGQPRKGDPDHQLLRSEDGGDTWTTVAVRRGDRGALPWGAGVAPGPTPAQIEVTADGRLFALGVVQGDQKWNGVFCSVDGGRRWARLCPR